ncbi:MAG: hypothetical protein QXN37_03170 [Candidatus Anstonellaceae archaeon]
MSIDTQVAQFGNANQLRIEKRSHLFSTPEVTISKVLLRNPFFGKEVLVEKKMELNQRRTPLTLPSAFFFQEQNGYLSRAIATSDSVHGQILQYYSLKLAATLFEAYFPKPHALRFFCQDGILNSLMYLEFPFENNAIKRKTKSTKKHDPLAERKRRKSFLSMDKIERQYLTFPFVFEISKAGIIHSLSPLNYYLANEHSVFFEIDGLNLHKVVRYIELLPQTFESKRKASAYAALILAAAIHAQVSNFVSLYGADRLEEHGENVVLFYKDYFNDFASFSRLMIRLATDTKFKVQGRHFLFFELDYAKNAVPFDFLKYNLDFFRINLLALR